jgi:hypothetical protein
MLALLALERAAADVAPHLDADLDDEVLMAMQPAWLPTARGSRDQAHRCKKQPD